MPLDTLTVSVVGIIVCNLIYVAIALCCKQPRELQTALLIALSWTGVVTFGKLGYTTFAAEPGALGILENEKISILLGAGSIIWVSISSGYAQILSPLGSRQKPAEPQPESARAD